MRSVSIIAPEKINDTDICLPLSKSISNRLLILQKLAAADLQIQKLSDADDTILLNKILSGNSQTIYCKNAGTVLRFMIAYCSITPGNWIIDGDERLRQRPVGALVDALVSLGADINYCGKTSYPPLAIKAKILKGGNVVISANISSQFISALMLIAPFLSEGLTIELTAKPVSFDYILMTMNLLKYFGVEISLSNNIIKVSPQKEIVQKKVIVEADWSSASFIYGIASLYDQCNINLIGLKKDSWQGDALIAGIMEQFGVSTLFYESGAVLTRTALKIRKFEYDMTSYPDLIPPMVVLCIAHHIPFRIKGIESLRIKESDRVSALISEISKLGIRIYAENDLLYSENHFNIQKGEFVFDSYNDHRIAMSFSMLSVIIGKIGIKNSMVTQKSYPRFWDDLIKLGFIIKDQLNGREYNRNKFQTDFVWRISWMICRMRH